MAPSHPATVDVAGATNATRMAVDGYLQGGVGHLFWFGHGEDDALMNGVDRIVDAANVDKVTYSVIAIACYSAVQLGPFAVSNQPGPYAYLGFDDELGFPASAPAPIALAVTGALRGYVTGGDDLDHVTQNMRVGLDSARIQYKTNGGAMGLSPGESRMAWLFAKSNRYSLTLCGDGSVKF